MYISFYLEKKNNVHLFNFARSRKEYIEDIINQSNNFDSIE
jgi:hypothetical protein